MEFIWNLLAPERSAERQTHETARNSQRKSPFIGGAFGAAALAAASCKGEHRAEVGGETTTGVPPSADDDDTAGDDDTALGDDDATEPPATTNDRDRDGLSDSEDGCPDRPLAEGQTSHRDDTDCDGLRGVRDICPVTPLGIGQADHTDADGDGRSPDCSADSRDDIPNETDDDGDGVVENAGADNCPGVFNPGQEDGDGDGFGAACESNDSDPSSYPGATDPKCDGRDQNGDGVGALERESADGTTRIAGEPECECREGAERTDVNGLNVGTCYQGTEKCVADTTSSGEVTGTHWAPKPGDETRGPQSEAAFGCDGQDNNCNGIADEEGNGVGLPCECLPEETQDCGCSSDPGTQVCTTSGQWDTECVGGRPVTDEVPNGEDDDCDGETDEGIFVCTPGTERDCGTDEGNCTTGKNTCTLEGRWTTECRDAYGNLAQGREDEAPDGEDNDCDGDTDEGFECAVGAERDCGSNVGKCEEGKNVCDEMGHWGEECVDETAPAASDVCGNNTDDNCDGTADEGCICDPGATRTCGITTGECTDGTQQCVPTADGSRWDTACVDSYGNPAVGPQTELPNGFDDDCDNQVDEGFDCIPDDTRGCGTDTGACSPGVEECNSSGHWSGVCDGEVEPSTELCGTGLDEDCDNTTDEGCPCAPGQERACGTATGECTDGKQQCGPDGQWDPDCLDSYGHAAVGPATEAPDRLDNDCDGTTDEGFDCLPGETKDCGTDTGDCVKGDFVCGADGMWGEDCVGETGPAATDACNDNRDNDCDGVADEGCTPCEPGETRPCGTDEGNCEPGDQYCGTNGEWGSQCLDGYGNPAQGPTAERPNDVDDDCDGVADEGMVCMPGDLLSCGTDVGECDFGTQSCNEETGQWNSVCNDVQGRVAEICNGLDDDCDGTTDEGMVCPPPTPDGGSTGGFIMEQPKGPGDFLDQMYAPNHGVEAVAALALFARMAVVLLQKGTRDRVSAFWNAIRAPMNDEEKAVA